MIYQCSTSCPSLLSLSMCVLAWSSEVMWLTLVCVFPIPKEEADQPKAPWTHQTAAGLARHSVSLSECGWDTSPVSRSDDLQPSRGLFVWMQTVMSCNQQQACCCTHAPWSHSRAGLNPEPAFVHAEHTRSWLLEHRQRGVTQGRADGWGTMPHMLVDCTLLNEAPVRSRSTIFLRVNLEPAAKRSRVLPKHFFNCHSEDDGAVWDRFIPIMKKTFGSVV